MDSIAGFEKTGRVTLGPGADLVELVSENGLRHTAVVFHPEYRDHPAIGPALDVIVGFLEAPYVTNLNELVARDASQGAFVYPTGQVWSVYEVVRTLADLGQVGGIRAGLELMYLAGEILVEAAENGEPNGVYSHGGLTPWRVLLKADGQVEIMGYALPQVEILQFHANADNVPKEDSFRYCPPERMEAAAEEVSADLFGLTLIAFELMTGKPLYDGLVNDIRTQASRGATSRRLFRFKDDLPGPVRDLLTEATRARPQDRYPDGPAFIQAVQKVLSRPDIEGASLREIMSTVSRFQRPTGQQLEGTKTQALSKSDLAKLLEEEDDLPSMPPRRDAAPGGDRAKAWTPPSPTRRPRAPRRDPTASGSAPALTSGDRPAAPPREDDLRRSGDRSSPSRSGDRPSLSRSDARPDLRSSMSRPNPRASMSRANPRASMSRPNPRVEEPHRSAPPAEPPARALDESDSSGASSRWGRPDPGRRRRVPRRRVEVSMDETPAQRIAQPPPAPAPEPEPEPSEEMARLTSSDADAILEAINSSGGGRAPRRGASAADVIESILSGSRAGPSPSPPAGPADEDEEVAPAPRPAPRRAPRRARSAPAFGPASDDDEPTLRPALSISEPAPEPTPVAAPEPTPVAAPEPTPVAAPEPPPAPPPEPTGTQPLPFELLGVDDDDTEAEPTGELPTPAAPPTPTLFPSAHGLALDPPRAPDPLRSDLSGRPRAIHVLRGPGGERFKVRLPSNASLAEAVSYLLGTLVPVRTDLQGRVTFGYRLGPAEGPALGTQKVEAFAEDSELTLHPIPARDVWFTLVVEDDENPARFRAPLSAAVPVAAVVDHLCAWLRLPAGAWSLSQGGEAILPHLLVDELSPEAPLVLSR